MKKYCLVTLLVAIIVIAVAYATIDDFNYEVDMIVIHAADRGDGLYCTPHRCADLVHEYSTLYHASMAYMELYGPYDSGRPTRMYKYNSQLHAYVKWVKF